MPRFFTLMAFASIVLFALSAGAEDKLNTPPEGFTALFNGQDLTNWKGLLKGPYDKPADRAKLSDAEREKLQAEADADMKEHWSAKDGILVFDGKGRSLATAKDYGDFEMYVDWKIEKNGDSGIYLRGLPQVQIWDPGMGGANAVGSGGLYNNKNKGRVPLKVADKPVGEWNTFWIKMVGDNVTVKLNGELVVDNAPLENLWEQGKPIPATGQIELQNHGNSLYFRNIYIKELK
jgi:hypothetical protein